MKPELGTRSTAHGNGRRALKILSVVGARPNFMKIAPIIGAIYQHNERLAASSSGQPVQHVLVHTGQHYDGQMSDSFFTDLNLPSPDVHLGVGSGSHAAQTAEIMKRFEEVVLREKPDAIIVVGDVNSTVACALVTAKVSWDVCGTRALIAHVEAGLRSFDRTMPEECNRVLTDHLSDLLFVTEETGIRNLAKEGIAKEKVHFVGNTMIDSLLAFKARAEVSSVLDELGLRNGTASKNDRNSVVPYALLTLHRPANVDSREAFAEILEGLLELARSLPVVFPVHPRTRKRIEELGLQQYFGQGQGSGESGSENGSRVQPGFRLIPSLGYLDFLCLMKHARLVVTDSGGIQEETTCLGVPCVTTRENTERPVTLRGGTNVLGGVTREGIRKAIQRQMRRKIRNTAPEKWDGKTAARIVKVLTKEIRKRRSAAESTPLAVTAEAGKVMV